MKRPLVFPLSDPKDEALQELILFYNETLGFCPNSIKTMQINPRIAAAFIEMNKAVMENRGKVSSALKRLIGYVSSLSAGCHYCQAHTIRAAERYEASTDQMNHIWDYATHPAFSEAERAALDFSVAASSIPNAVSNEIADRLRLHWSDADIVEILGVVALFGYLNRWNDSMGTPLEDGAIESGKLFLERKGWSIGKHAY